MQARRPTKQRPSRAKARRLVHVAEARNGENTLLLDILEKVVALGGQVSVLLADRQAQFDQHRAMALKLDSVDTRLDRVEQVTVKIEPVVWKLEGNRVEGVGQQKLIGGILRLKHAIYAVIVAAAAYVGIHLPKIN